MAAISSSVSAIVCLSGTPTSEAGHGGMCLVSVTVLRPSDTDWASPAVSMVSWWAPIWPVLWHETQLASRMGCTVLANDGASSASLASGPVIVVGMVRSVGSYAVSFRVSVTSSEVETMPGDADGAGVEVRQLGLGGGGGDEGAVFERGGALEGGVGASSP